MEKEASKVKKLDDILLYLNDNISHSFGQVMVSLNLKKREEEKFTLDELRIALKKLSKDEYVHLSIGNDVVTISWEGSLFIELGGYTARVSKSEADALLTQTEIDRSRTLDDLLAKNSTRLNVLTNRLFWATVAATVVAVFVLVWYVWSYYHPLK